mmetsp:Transcript_21808/g.72108  ORF Transcript_21808/g.72108 Transcript_21808/m.72108 type:complete len:214 (-) Transcript_21808:185-826(-)
MRNYFFRAWPKCCHGQQRGVQVPWRCAGRRWISGSGSDQRVYRREDVEEKDESIEEKIRRNTKTAYIRELHLRLHLITPECAAWTSSPRDCVKATEVDSWAIAAIGMNAQLNQVEHVQAEHADVVGRSRRELDMPDLIFAGDVMYEQELARHVGGWLMSLKEEGCRVLVGDPGRFFLDRSRLHPTAAFQLPELVREGSNGFEEANVWEFRENC